MNQSIVYTSADILDRIPHRFENLLIDTVNRVQSETEYKGVFSVTFSENNDPRDIFFQSISANSSGLIRTVLMEILALASIVSTDYPDDSIIIFASISNFVVHSDPPIGVPLVGEVIKLKDKGNFVRCKGVIGTQNNPEIGYGELMAFIITKAQLESAESTPKLVDLPPTPQNIPVDKSTFKKRAEMVVCDTIRHSFAQQTIVGEYCFPLDHPLTKGHFPGNPIMMGIMQLLAIEDICTHQFLGKIQFANTTIAGDCQLIRQDGALIADIKQFEVANLSDRSAFKSVKKVVFRESIRPGDQFFIHLHNLTLG